MDLLKLFLEANLDEGPHDKMFKNNIADVQRHHKSDGAEETMIKIQMTLGGGVLNGVIEHGGDLLWRMTEKGKFTHYGREAVINKVEKVSRWLSNEYGFEKEHLENIASNAKYRNKNPQELKQEVDALLQKYAEEHEKLPVYNRAQYAARKFAVLIGQQKWDQAVQCGKIILSMANDKDQWIQTAGSVDPQYADGSKMVEYDDPGDYIGGMSPEDLEALRKSNEFEMQYNKSKAPDLGGADIKPYRERRGFIDPEGKIVEIGGMGHDQYVHEKGYTSFRRLDDFYKATGWVRWSPETDAFSGGLTLTDAQIKTMKDILAEYGFYGLVFELITKNGGKQVIGFNDQGSVDAKIAKIQHLINDKQVDKKKKMEEFKNKMRSMLGLE